MYDVRNVLVRSLRWAHEDVAAQLADLLTLVGPPLVCAPDWPPGPPRSPTGTS